MSIEQKRQVYFCSKTFGVSFIVLYADFSLKSSIIKAILRAWLSLVCSYYGFCFYTHKWCLLCMKKRQIDKESKLSKWDPSASMFVVHFLSLCYNLEEIQTMSNYIICHYLQWWKIKSTSIMQNEWWKLKSTCIMQNFTFMSTHH